MEKVQRYTVSIDKRLFDRFELWMKGRGYENRSEAIRDLIRRSLVEEEWSGDSENVVATVTLIYDHHIYELAQRLAHVQHDHGDAVVASTHVHLDHDNCLEVIILRGPSRSVKALSEKLISMKGVKHGKSVQTTTGKQLW